MLCEVGLDPPQAMKGEMDEAVIAVDQINLGDEVTVTEGRQQLSQAREDGIDGGRSDGAMVGEVHDVMTPAAIKAHGHTIGQGTNLELDPGAVAEGSWRWNYINGLFSGVFKMPQQEALQDLCLCRQLGSIGEMLQGTAAAVAIEGTGRGSAIRRGDHDLLQGGKAVGFLFHVDGSPHPVPGGSKGDEIDLAAMSSHPGAAMG
jgi:hypothetical protein